MIVNEYTVYALQYARLERNIPLARRVFNAG